MNVDLQAKQKDTHLFLIHNDYFAHYEFSFHEHIERIGREALFMSFYDPVDVHNIVRLTLVLLLVAEVVVVRGEVVVVVVIVVELLAVEE